MIDRPFAPSVLVCVGLLLATAAGPVAAQYEDDTLEDYENQDRRYLERYKKKGEEAERPTATDDDTRATEFIALADELIRDKNYRSHTTDRFRVQTDDPRVNPKAVARLLEGFVTYFEKFWAGELDLQPRETVSRVFLFYSFHKYNQLLAGDWRFSTVRPKGHYLDGVNAITLHTDAAVASDLADVLIHEEAHLLAGERIFTAEFGPPTWVSEGLASYFGYTYMDAAGRFHPGEIGGKKVALLRGARPAQGGEGKQRLAALKRLMKSNTEGPGLTDVVGIRDPADFYSRPDWSYSASWVLVHELLHGEDAAHRPGFARYLRRAIRGEAAPEVLYEELGTGSVELERVARAHLKRLKAR